MSSHGGMGAKTKIGIAAGAALVLVGGAAVFFFAMRHIDAGHIGVEIGSCSDGGVRDTPVGVGYHFAGPCTSYVKFPTYQQTLVLCKAPHEGSMNDDSITVTSSEGLPINVDVSLSFTIDPSKAPHIYSKFRMDLSHIMNSYMRQTIREALQETFAKYTAQQLYSDRREQSRAEAQGIVTQKLTLDGFVVTQFTLNETRIPAAVSGAIMAKVAMVQEAQRAEQEIKKSEAEGRQRLAKAEADAKAAKISAEGAAQATKARAEAEAWANERLAKSLSPALVEYMKAKQWNGVLPQVTGGSVPMITLGK